MQLCCMVHLSAKIQKPFRNVGFLYLTCLFTQYFQEHCILS